MAATYLARIASLCSDITIKLAAVSAAEKSVSRLPQYSKNVENTEAGRIKYVPRRPTVRNNVTLIEAASPDAKAEGSEFLAFIRDLEALRSQMIKSCLQGREISVEMLCEVVADKSIVTAAVDVGLAAGRPVLPRAFHEAVTDAVRLLNCP